MIWMVILNSLTFKIMGLYWGPYITHYELEFVCVCVLWLVSYEVKPKPVLLVSRYRSYQILTLTLW